MAHEAQKQFLKQVKDQHPERFNNATVLDCGSLDINGNNRFIFDKPEYTGIDIGPGPNVDVVAEGGMHTWKTKARFDVVISCEMLEHDIHWEKSLSKMVELTKPGGMVILTMAGKGRPEHGTTKAHAWTSPLTTKKDPAWADFYKTFEATDIVEAIQKRTGRNMEEIFEDAKFMIPEEKKNDLYFVGITKEKTSAAKPTKERPPSDDEQQALPDQDPVKIANDKANALLKKSKKFLQAIASKQGITFVNRDTKTYLVKAIIKKAHGVDLSPK